MAAVVLTIILAFFGGAGVWLSLGPRFAFDEVSQKRNDILNLLCYVGFFLPVAFALVFYGIERL